MTTYSKRQLARLAAGLCAKCGLPRTAEPGFTANNCATCAEQGRVRSVIAMRKRRGQVVDAPIETRARGPRKSHVSEVERSDVVVPERVADAQALTLPGSKPPTMYGSLTLADIRRETSKLPLKPPGK